MTTVFKVYDHTGKLHEIEIRSPEAVLRLLKNPSVQKLHDGEPFFLLRAQDSTAPQLVHSWAVNNHSTAEPGKVVEAQLIASGMRKWPGRRIPT